MMLLCMYAQSHRLPHTALSYQLLCHSIRSSQSCWQCLQPWGCQTDQHNKWVQRRGVMTLSCVSQHTAQFSMRTGGAGVASAELLKAAGSSNHLMCKSVWSPSAYHCLDGTATIMPATCQTRSVHVKKGLCPSQEFSRAVMNKVSTLH